MVTRGVRFHVFTALLITMCTATAPIAAQTTQLTQTDWRFFTDAASDGAMTPLAAM